MRDLKNITREISDWEGAAFKIKLLCQKKKISLHLIKCRILVWKPRKTNQKSKSFAEKWTHL